MTGRVAVASIIYRGWRIRGTWDGGPVLTVRINGRDAHTIPMTGLTVPPTVENVRVAIRAWAEGNADRLGDVYRAAAQEENR